MNDCRSMRGRMGIGLAGLIVGALAAYPATAETRGYAVQWLTAASYNQDGDCAGGVNVTFEEQQNKELLAMGYPKELVDKWNADPKKYRMDKADAMNQRCKIDGKPVNCETNPQAMPDPHLNAITGKYAYGFNLDGKGADSPNSFEEPDTHEKGINNQMFRAMACFTIFRGDAKNRPVVWQESWDMVRSGMPAWLISLSGDNLDKDGPATITFDRAREHIERDAASDILFDQTFRIDGDPRNHITFQGEIKDGVFTVTEHKPLTAIFGELQYLTQITLRDTHLRLKLLPNGKIDGILGGYQPFHELQGTGFDTNSGVDMMGLYYLLKNNADANPDPKTGQNREISAAYRLEAVPAFLIPPPDAKTAQAGQ